MLLAFPIHGSLLTPRRTGEGSVCSGARNVDVAFFACDRNKFIIFGSSFPPDFRNAYVHQILHVSNA